MEIGAIWGTVGLDPGPLQKGLTKAEKSLTGFKSKAAKLAAGAGVAIAGGIGASVVAGMNLEPAGKKLVAQLRLSGEEAKRVSALAGKVYADNWGESMDDAAGRVGAVITSIDGMADATDEVAMRTIAAISGLTDTMELDFDRTTQVIGQMMRTGMVKDAVAGADLLAVTMSRVPKAVREDVLDAVDEYGPFFQQLGIEGEAAMAMLAKGAEKGMYGIDKTGDAIKELTIRATDGSAASSAAFETMGLNAQAMASAFATGGETAKGALDRTIDGLLSIEDPAVRAQTAIALFGTPLEDLNVGEIPEFLRGLKQTGDALGDTGGAATQMGDTLNSSASANIERFKRQIINTAVNAIGNHFLPAISAAAGWAADNFGPAVKGAGEALKAFGGWVKDNASWLTPLGAGLATVAAGLALLALQAKIVAAGGLIKFIIGAITSTNACTRPAIRSARSWTRSSVSCGTSRRSWPRGSKTSSPGLSRPSGRCSRQAGSTFATRSGPSSARSGARHTLSHIGLRTISWALSPACSLALLPNGQRSRTWSGTRCVRPGTRPAGRPTRSRTG